MPNTPSRVPYLQSALELTHKMMAVAKAGEWDLLPDLERERHQAINSAFVQPVPPTEADPLLGLTREILEANLELLSLSKKGRQELSAGLKKITTGRRAVTAYEQVKSR